MRLAGSTKTASGRVEMCIRGVWGAVCDDGWDTQDANVVCNQLGYFDYGKETLYSATACIECGWLSNSGAVPRYGAFYGESSRPTVAADFLCSGTEEDLLSCERKIFSVANCSSYEEAGVKCLGRNDPSYIGSVPPSSILFRVIPCGSEQALWHNTWW